MILMIAKLAWKNITKRKTRSLLSMLGVAVGVALLVSLISISDGIRKEATDSLGKIQGIMVQKKDVIDPALGLIGTDIKKDIEQIDGVKTVMPMVFTVAWTVEGESRFRGFTNSYFLAGIDPEKASQTRGGTWDVKRGRELKSSDRYSAIVSQTFVDEYNKDIGSKIKLNGTSFRIVGVYDSGSSMSNMQIFIPIDIVRDMANIDKKQVSAYYVEAIDPKNTTKLAKKIEFKVDGIEAKTGNDYAKDIDSFLSVLDAFLWAISLVGAIVAALGIINTMVMSVMERRREIGVLKAVGWTNWDVMKEIIIESLLLSIGGGILGIGVGIIGVNALKAQFGLKYLYISHRLILTTLGFSTIIGVIGGVYPSKKAAELSPIEALRYE